MIFPKLLNENDTILLISTARKVNLDELKYAISVFENWGLKVVLGKNLFQENNQFAGSDEQRTEDLQWAINHPTASAIMCVRGGYGTARIIDSINFSAFSTYPKWVCGFSDCTVLHSHLQKLGFASIHSTMPLFFSNPNYKNSVESLKKILFYGLQILDNQTFKSHILNIKNNIKGVVIGGNLSIIHHLIGTNSDLDFENKVLFIEDIDEYLYHIDRIMNQLDRAGKLKKLAGLIVGHFTDMKDNAIPFGKNAYEIIQEYAQKYQIPTLFGFQAGHDFDNLSIILGKEININITNNQS